MERDKGAVDEAAARAEAEEVVATITQHALQAEAVAAGDEAAKKKKKKKKKAKKPAGVATEAALDLLGERKMLERFENLDLSTELKEARPNHPFWHSQPVIAMKESAKVDKNEPIEVKTLEEVSKAGLDLPAGFEWVEVEVQNDAEMTVVYELLRNHYVTDDDGLFRFDYGVPLLRWAMCPPGWLRSWHIGVRRVKDKQLVGFITAVPCHARVYDAQIKMVEINFLCVHKQYRDKRLAPVLIKEITRRVNLQNIWQAVFTAGVVLPHAISSCRYYHRSLNPKKLIDIGFSHQNKKLTMSATIKLYALPPKTATPGLRPLEARDVAATRVLLNKYLAAFHLSVEFSEEEFAHWFLPRQGVVYAYVVESKEHKITDFLSFYRLPSSVLGNAHHSTLEAAYSFYNVALTVSWQTLIQDALILAKSLNFDVFNCLDLMDNETFLTELKFGKGDGSLQYYLFNWKCAPTRPKGIGLVLM
jgi:glycylpeptide N-tetradecanoyltransferase